MRKSLFILLAVVSIAIGDGILSATELTYVDALRRFSPRPRGAAVSPDGRHLYVGHSVPDAVGVYEIDPMTDLPEAIGLLQNDRRGVTGLQGAQEIVVSPDGHHVYVASTGDDALVDFAREPAGGQLTPLTVLRDGEDGLDGLGNPTGLAVSPDGAHLYVTAYLDPGISVYGRDPSTGALVQTQRKTPSGLNGPQGVAVSPDGNHVYATGGLSDAVVVFEREPATGGLTVVETQWNGSNGVWGLHGPRGVAVSPDGSSVYVAGHWDGTVAHFWRDPVTGHLTFVDAVQNGVGGVTGLSGPLGIMVSHDGNTLVATGFYSDSIALFQRGPATGALTFVESHTDGAGGVTGMRGPLMVTSGADGGTLYLGTYYGDGVPVFDFDSTTATAVFVEADQDVPTVKGLAGVAETVVSEDGEHAYVAGRNDQAVAVLGRDALRGRLSFIEQHKDGSGGVDGIRGASAVVLSPDQAHVYVAGEDDDGIGVFSRDPSTGELSFESVVKDGVGGVDGLAGVEGLAASSDGGHLYAAGRTDDALAIFARDGSTGALTFVDVVQDGVGGVNGLDSVVEVAVAQDGQHVYAVADFDSAVTVFDRDDVTGALTFVELEKQGVGGVSGMLYPESLAISPDDLHLYVVGKLSDGLAVFERDPGTGELDFLESHFDGVAGVSGLGRPRSVVVSPDGERVFAGAETDDTVVVFARDTATGELSYLETHVNGVDCVGGLETPEGLAMSPDGLHLYVGGADDEAVAVFRRWAPVADSVPDEVVVADGRRWYALDVAACALGLSVELSQLNGDLDLSTRYGQPPTSAEFDCLSSQPGTADEVCIHAAPTAGRWWVGVEKFDGSAAPVTGTLTATVEGCDGQGLVSWWRADGTTDDAVGPNDGVAEGGLGYQPAIVDQAFAMDGIDAAVRIPHDSSLDPGSGDLSFSFWIATDDVGGFRSLVDGRSLDPVLGAQAVLHDGRPGMVLGDGTQTVTVFAERVVTGGEFHHLAMVVDRDLPTGGRIYIDGRLDSVFDPSWVLGSLNSSEDITFGRRTDAAGGDGHFSGLIDEIRISHRALPRREAVDGLGALVSWWPADGDATDHGGLNHADGSPNFTQGRWGPAFDFTSSLNDDLIVPHHPSLDLGTGDFSVACWVWSTAAAQQQTIFDSRNADPVGVSFGLNLGEPRLIMADASGSSSFEASTEVTDGRLHFLVVTVDRDDPDGLEIWVDGVPLATLDPTSVPDSLDSSENWRIGRRNPALGSGQHFRGAVDELQVYDRALTATEIEWLFASEGLLFLDGFESGDSIRWSATNP